MEQDDIINPSPGAEIPKKAKSVIISYGCVTNPGTSASVAVARAMQTSTTLESPPTPPEHPPGSPKQGFSRRPGEPFKASSQHLGKGTY